MTFDTIVTVDWSGGNAKGPKPCADAIWVSVIRDGAQDLPAYFRSRQDVEPWLTALLEAELAANRRTLLGLDFAFGYPAGAAERITGSPDPLGLWDWLEDRITDAAQVHVTAQIIQSMLPAKLDQTLNVPQTPEGWIFGVAG